MWVRSGASEKRLNLKQSRQNQKQTEGEENPKSKSVPTNVTELKSSEQPKASGNDSEAQAPEQKNPRRKYKRKLTEREILKRLRTRIRSFGRRSINGPKVTSEKLKRQAEAEEVLKSSNRAKEGREAERGQGNSKYNIIDFYMRNVSMRQFYIRIMQLEVLRFTKLFLMLTRPWWSQL